MPVTVNEHGEYATIQGNAIRGFRMKVAMLAMKMYIESNGRLMASRNATPTTMRQVATEFTGKPYARSRKGLELAYIDLLHMWNMKNGDLDAIGETSIVNEITGGGPASCFEDPAALDMSAVKMEEKGATWAAKELRKMAERIRTRKQPKSDAEA
jgi:hypothetical protein